MYQALIRLEKVEDVKRLVAVCTPKPFAIEVRGGDYVVNGKSIMGIFSLDLSRELTLFADCGEEEAEAFAESIQEFVVGAHRS